MRSLRWWTVLLPTAAIIVVDYARHALIIGFLHPWWDEAALMAGVFLVALATSQLLLARIDRSQRREHRADALRRIGMEIASSLKLEVIISSVLQRTMELLEADCAGVTVAGSDRRELIYQTRGSTALRRVLPTAETHFPWEVMESAEPKELLPAMRGPVASPCSPCQHCLALPLKMGPQVLGVLCFGSTTTRDYGTEERRMTDQLADLASVGIANGLLYERAQNLATLEERDRIAREIHDTIAQVLGYLSMKADGAREFVRRKDLPRLERELTEMKHVADDAYVDVREAILGLRLSARISGDLREVLEQYLQKFTRQSGVVACLEARHEIPLALPPETEIQLVRVIQEALTNVRKHSHATNAWVKMETYKGGVRVSVSDNGRGFDPHWAERQTESTYGIVTMRERLASIGGQLTVESIPGSGTTIVATVPLSDTEGDKDDQA